MEVQDPARHARLRMFSQDLSSNNLDSGAWYLELGWQCLAMLGQKPLTYTTLLTRAPRQGKNVAILGLFLSDWTNRLAGLLDGNGALLVSSRFTFLFCQSRQDAIPNESVCPSQFQGACIYCRHFFFRVLITRFSLILLPNPEVKPWIALHTDPVTGARGNLPEDGGVVLRLLR